MLKAISIARKLGVTIRFRRPYVENNVYDDWSSAQNYCRPLNPKQILESNLMIPTSSDQNHTSKSRQQNHNDLKPRNLKNIIFLKDVIGYGILL